MLLSYLLIFISDGFLVFHKVKVVSLVFIAVCLFIIAWNSFKEVSYLQEIQDKLSHIVSALKNQ